MKDLRMIDTGDNIRRLVFYAF